MSTAAQQNAMMLASLIGVDEAKASERLAMTVLITAPPGNKSDWAAEIGGLLGRTLSVRFEQAGPVPDVELVIADAVPRTSAARLYADVGSASAVASLEPVVKLNGQPHGLQAAAAACAVTAAAVHTVIAADSLPHVRLPMRLDFAQLGIPGGIIDRPLDIGQAVMAGAGAVAHAFLWAARHLDIRGELTIVDPKTVQAGILNRCLYLHPDDIGRDKATVLAERAQPAFPGLRLRPHVGDFKSFVKPLPHPPETVFVTVDSRHVRRSIQEEVPRRIVDASTTDASGVVVHSNLLPTENACLACIYRHVPEEHARERSIAEGLGVDLVDVRSGLITPEIAQRIILAHPAIDVEDIVGLAFDSLFRQLCSEQALATPEGRQVLAPFAFVSAWAGVLQAIETLRSFAGMTATNYWQVDPWKTPSARARTLRPRHPDCQFCSKPEFEPIISNLWGATVPPACTEVSKTVKKLEEAK
jgi:molybdopterin/thiamine biosynthesis adenylyltransferase